MVDNKESSLNPKAKKSQRKCKVRQNIRSLVCSDWGPREKGNQANVPNRLISGCMAGPEWMWKWSVLKHYNKRCGETWAAAAWISEKHQGFFGLRSCGVFFKSERSLHKAKRCYWAILLYWQKITNKIHILNLLVFKFFFTFLDPGSDTWSREVFPQSYSSGPY